jgi:excisionase family DNA binding protein
MDARNATRPAGARLNGNGVAGGHGGLPHLIDVATLAEHLGLTERTIRRKVAQGEIPHYKIGSSIRFDPGEIEAWLEACRVVAHISSTAGAENGTRP